MGRLTSAVLIDKLTATDDPGFDRAVLLHRGATQWALMTSNLTLRMQTQRGRGINYR